MTGRMQAIALVSSLMCLGIPGCGESRTKMNLAKVTGHVVCEGKPVPFVTVYFVPQPQGKNAQPGKFAMGQADDSGEFTLSTYDENDGAVLGKHQVRVGPPLGEESRDFKCACALDDAVDLMPVEVALDKDNDFEIKLNLPKDQPARKTTLGTRNMGSAQDAEVDD